MKKICVCVLSSVLFVWNLSFSQSGPIVSTPLEYVPPPNDPPMIFEAGIGTGVMYGTFGGRLSYGNELVSADMGIGIVPFAWDAVFAAGGSIHLLDRYSGINPRVTILYTSAAAYNLLLVGDNGLETYYKENFPGISGMAGVDIRFNKSSNYFFSVNIGFMAPFIGTSEVQSRFEKMKQQMESEGYVVEEITNDGYRIFPKISIGLSYVIGRSLQLR